MAAAADGSTTKTQSEYASNLFVFTNSKAGMDNIDKEKVNRVVHEMSKDSLYYKNSLLHDEKTVEKLREMKVKIQNMTEFERRISLKRADELLIELEAKRDLSRVCIVCDMDMFYAAVEMRDDPTLKQKPLAVGGNDMISTTNYIARQFGVRAAMPGFIGKKLCPDLVFVKPNFEKYTAVAEEIRSVFAQYDPKFIACSLDEACLDITDYYHAQKQRYVLDQDDADVGRRDDAFRSKHEQIVCAIANEMRRKIFEKTQLTASAGIACNATLAKVCSDLNKPNGQYYLPNDTNAILDFVSTLSVRKFTGVGKVMDKMLDGLGIKTGYDLYVHREKLVHVFKPLTHQWLLRLSRGIQSEARRRVQMKSMSKEHTFASTDKREMHLEICQTLCYQMADLLKEVGSYMSY